MQRTILITLSDIHEVFGPLKRVAEGGKLVSVTYDEMKKFDLDLKFGHLGEDFVRDMQNGNTMIEVKTERDIWKRTENIAVEIRCRGKLSGISTTDAKMWIHMLDGGGGGFIFPVDELRKKIKKRQKDGTLKLTMGGDDNAAQLALLPIKELFT